MPARRRSTDGEGLIFLISQPRSGSTLLQYVLASHPQIGTGSESWLLLPLVYMRRHEGWQAEYNALFATRSLEGYLDSIDDGRAQFDQQLATFASSVYDLARGERTLFLDKTPRYYLIIEDLARIFPRARFVFILRNPLSVLASIIRYNFHGDWPLMLRQPDRKLDLVAAPEMIAHAVGRLDRVAVVHYRELVVRPEAAIRKMCEDLALPFDAAMLDYSRFTLGDSDFQDTKSVQKHTAPVDDYLDIWRDDLSADGAVALARAYVEDLREETLQLYGCDKQALLRELRELDAAAANVTASARWLEAWDRAGPLMRVQIQFEQLRRRQGTVRACLVLARAIFRRFLIPGGRR